MHHPVSPPSLGSFLRPPPSWTSLEHPPPPRGHPYQMPEPPQLAHFHAKEQRLYSDFLTVDGASHPISKVSQKAHLVQFNFIYTIKS
ncbi:hypothetical protein PFLUV_G00199170 [Perca fluviatilis]|uniref:Uncharacterized protein n=1 Tax=Perca fluviatilis TaxID=8168 RepID=A0A6A5DTG8_PERFL|nr:hypothetical protein PFLUV_G00199170 [Perca fluviatilis]